MKIYLFGLLFSASPFCFSQSNTVSSGGNASGIYGSLSYTIGQIDYSNSTSASGNMNQGVQQPFEFYTISSGIDELNSLGVSLYPNPTNDYIVLNLNSVLEHLTYQLTDVNGRLVSIGEIITNETIIDTRNYSVGEYHLSIIQQGSHIQSYKIIKN